MKKIITPILVSLVMLGLASSCGFGGSKTNDNVLVYGDKEIPLKVAVGSKLENTGMPDNTMMFVFMGVDLAKIAMGENPSSLIYISITDDLIGKTIDLVNPVDTGSFSFLAMSTKVDGIEVAPYIYAAQGGDAGAEAGSIAKGTFLLSKDTKGDYTLELDATMKDGKPFSASYSGTVITADVEGILKAAKMVM